MLTAARRLILIAVIAAAVLAVATHGHGAKAATVQAPTLAGVSADELSVMGVEVGAPPSGLQVIGQQKAADASFFGSDVTDVELATCSLYRSETVHNHPCYIIVNDPTGDPVPAGAISQPDVQPASGTPAKLKVVAEITMVDAVTGDFLYAEGATG
jgi:hypothetical protein